jgi:hypothetical protein
VSWLISRAMMEAYANSRSLPGRVEEFSAATCSDGEPCAQLSVMPTQHPFWLRDKTIEPLSLSRFGQTCSLLTAGRGAELLTWYLAGFRARTSASRAEAKDSAAHALGYGWKWPGSFAKWDPATSSWKTRQCSLTEGWTAYSETWPAWGSMRDGECLERTTPALAMSEKESGFWPTPTKRDSRTLAGSQPPKRAPTSGLPLAWTVALAIPKEERSGGRLNPPWVEWLMGWPTHWTGLQPLATAKFQLWRQQHGAFLAASENPNQQPKAA